MYQNCAEVCTVNTQENKTPEKKESNDIAIRSRRHIDVTGVKDVQSFDDRSVSAITCLGEMVIEGEELRIETLDTDRGIISVDGKICAVIYYDEHDRAEKKQLFGGIFRH